MEVPLLVDDFLRRPAQIYPEKVAVVDGAAALHATASSPARVNQLSHALLRLGVAPGDRVCILSPNSHFFLESFYGTSQIGAILVPLNYRLTAADHEYILNHAGVTDGARRLGVHEGRRRDPRQADDRAELDRRAGRGRDAQGLARLERARRARARRARRRRCRASRTTWSRSTTRRAPTARPKGVMLTHRNCYINAYSLIGHMRVSH